MLAPGVNILHCVDVDVDVEVDVDVDVDVDDVGTWCEYSPLAESQIPLLPHLNSPTSIQNS